MIRTAVTLAHKGLAVFPCRPRDKLPATEHGCKDATTDLEIVRQWWCEEPRYNIGVATGVVSKVFAVDIDGDGEAEMRKLEAEHGALPATVEVITARGRHLYFQMPDLPVRNSASKLAPGIDVRGDGGYTLAPPNIHPSGRAYCWSVDSAGTFAAAPDWLLARVTSPAAGNGKARASPAVFRELMAGVEEGQRNDATARLCGYLLRHRIDPFVVLEILQLWNTAHCRPPLPAEEIQSVVDSIAEKEARRRRGE